MIKIYRVTLISPCLMLAVSFLFTFPATGWGQEKKPSTASSDEPAQVAMRLRNSDPVVQQSALKYIRNLSNQRPQALASRLMVWVDALFEIKQYDDVEKLTRV